MHLLAKFFYITKKFRQKVFFFKLSLFIKTLAYKAIYDKILTDFLKLNC